jgi:alkanesulfonate monooxygenase SsuD/methylene tetrahydromethanopterin reductase-like flavin-dependent oxidoreductase (luciferase family)
MAKEPKRVIPFAGWYYYAGRAKRITLGTCVIVLPWHDPIRLAEQIALLDVISGGRTLMALAAAAAPSNTKAFAFRWRRLGRASWNQRN